MSKEKNTLGSKDSPLKVAFMEASIGLTVWVGGAAIVSLLLDSPELAQFMLLCGGGITMGKAEQTYRYEKKIREFGVENNEKPDGPS